MDGTSTLNETPLDADVLCWRCRYNLRTRLPSQRCPECDTSIAESIERGREWAALLYRPGSAANALLLLAVSGGVEVSLSAAWWIAPEFFQLPAAYIAAMSVWLLSLMGTTAATFWFVVAMRPRLVGIPGEGWRVTVIGLRVVRTCITLVAFGLNVYVFYLNYVRLLGPAHLLVYAGSIAVHMPSMAAGVLIEVIALPYFLRLSRAMRSKGAFYVTIGLFVAQMVSVAFLFVDDLLRTAYLLSGSSFPAVSWHDLWMFHLLLAPWTIAVDAIFAAYVFAFSTRLRRFAGE